MLLTHFLIKSVPTAFMTGTAMIKLHSIMRYIQLLAKPQKGIRFHFHLKLGKIMRMPEAIKAMGCRFDAGWATGSNRP